MLHALRTLTVVALSIATGWATAARAQSATEGDTDEQLARGFELYRSGEFAAAARVFEAANTAEPSPQTLFAWAQAERLGGNCERAVELYAQFIAADPKPSHRQAAQSGIDRCASEAQRRPRAEAKSASSGSAPGPAVAASTRGSSPPTEPAKPEPAEPEPAPARTSPRASAASQPFVREIAPATGSQTDNVEPIWYKDKVGGVLLGSGVAAGGVAVALYVAARAQLSESRSAANYPSSSEAFARARSRRNAALVSAGVGVGFLAGAALRYLTLPSVGARDLTLSADAGADGAGLVLSGRF